MSHAHPHDIRLLTGGVDLFAAMVEAMDAARHEVLFVACDLANASA